MSNKEYTEKDILDMLKEKNEGSIIEGDTLLIADYNIKLKVRIAACQQINEKFSAQVLYFIEHPWFEQTLIESCAGVGNTANEAVEMCVSNFVTTVLVPLLAALKCESNEFITTEIMGKEHTFRVPCANSTVGMGGQFLENGDLWELVKDVIPQYIACKKVYWIKLFVAATEDNIICEARINNIVYSGLTELLRQRIKPNNKTEYGTYKAFVLLVQNDDTYEPCPYNIDQVGELTNAALDKFMKIHDQASHDEAINDIISSAPVPSLGWEMSGLIPEMYCMMVFGLGSSDSIMYFGKDGSSGTLRKSQLSSYDFIARAVYGYIKENKPSKEDNLKILASSAMYQSLYKAILDGAKMKDLKCSDLMYSVGNDYKIY